MLTPHPYQLDMAEFLCNTERAALLGRMGSGKTSATLLSLQWAAALDSNIFPVLIIAPKRVARSVWTKEIKAWGMDFDTSVMVGTAEERLAAFKARADVYTINFENIPWLRETLGDRWPYKTVIVDEASKLKGFRLRQGGVRSGALRDIQHLPKRWFNLSGSPSANGMHHLWGPYWFLDRGARLGLTYTGFEDRWFKPSPDGFGRVPFAHTQREITDLVADITYAFDPRKYFNIADPIEHTVDVELPPKARKHYDEIEKMLYTELKSGKKVEVFGAGSKSMKLLQIASGVLYTGEGAAADRYWEPLHEEKLDALESVAEECDSPLLVAYHFKSDLVRLKERFPQGRLLDDKQQTEDDWNAGKIPMLFLHPASAGHGLSLQHGGNAIAFYTCWWDRELYEQVIERIGPTRQFQSGYDRQVDVYHLTARRTVDEVVRKSLQTGLSAQDLLYQTLQEKYR